MARCFVFVCIVWLGCFVPPDEQHDSGLPSVDSGVIDLDAGRIDAGMIRVDCESDGGVGAPLPVALFPAGCTHLKGNLKVVGIAGGAIADSPTSSVSSLQDVSGRIHIDGVAMARGLRAFSKLERVSEALIIDTTDLPSVAAVDRLKEVGTLQVIVATGLQDIEFGSLEVIHGDLSLSGNTELSSLAGLRTLRVIEGSLILYRNPKLSAAALQAFTSRVAVDGGIVRP